MTRHPRDLPRPSARAYELLAELRRRSTLRESILGRAQRDREILGELEVLAEPAIVSQLLDELFVNARSIAEAAAAAVDAALARTPVMMLASVERVCRQSSPYYTFDWMNLRPAELNQVRRRGGAEYAIPGVASFHPSGYVREAAVEWLDALAAGRELPFLILRLNDWVPQVADRALAAVRRRLTSTHAAKLVEAFPLFLALRRSTRRDHQAVVDDVLAFLRHPGQRDAVAVGMQSPDRVVRRTCFQLARDAAGARMDVLLAAALRDPDPAIRFAAVTHSLAVLDESEVSALVETALGDPLPAVRRVAIDAAATRLPVSQALVWLERALLDPGRSVREITRFHLARLGAALDLPGYYRDALSRDLTPRVRATALAGLRETGTAADAFVALAFLDHQRPAVRRAAINAVAGLDGGRHLERLREMLRDPSPAVTRSAADALRPHIATVGIDGIRVALRAPTPPHRIHVAALAVALGKWKSLLALLELADDPEPKVRRAVHGWLTDWVARQNRAYTQPTDAQLDRIRHALARNGSLLDERTREEIGHAVAYWLRR
jgi:hypothetical protein